jgi:hypothetical protein
MADIRIKDLATTATSAASDDYLALDGSANGTRKILATNVAQNVTDVTFGTSGPSAKSSIAARASRQGLVFDGTAEASSTNIPAFGTSDFSVCGFALPTSVPTAYNFFVAGGNGAFAIGIDPTGKLYASKNNVTALSLSTGTATIGKAFHWGYTRSGTTGTYYINGVAAGTVTDNLNYTLGITSVGGGGTVSSVYMVGALDGIYAYNRALSAAEVVALYEAGVPAGADYNNASTGWILGTGATISGGKLNLTAVGAFDGATYWNLVTQAKKYRVTVVVDSIASGNLYITVGGAVGALITSAGTYTQEIIAAGNGAKELGIVGGSGGATAVIDSVSITALGLLLAPDAGQAGGGLTWYDTSGNAANITLPASGVTWNVPFAGTIAANSNLTLRPSSSTGRVTLYVPSPGGTTLTQQTVRTAANSRSWGFAINETAEGHWELMRSTSNSNSPSVPVLTADLSSNLTAAGNLTVSGTGTSSVAGKWLVGSTTAPSGGSATILAAASVGGGVQFANTGANVGGLINAVNGAGLTFYSYSGAVGSETYTFVGALNGSGNLILKSDGTDSSNGRIQLATHTTSAGGIGFGTAVSLFTSSTQGQLVIKDLVGNQPFFAFYNSSNSNLLAVGAISTTGYVNSASGPLQLWSNNTTALTLDSSQNATFAGDITANGGDVSINSAAGNAALNLNLAAATKAAVFFNQPTSDLVFRNQASSTKDAYLTSAGNFVFPGNITTAAPAGGTAAAWKLGTVATVSPTSPNRTIEVDIGGTIYYIHAKTTNN